MVRERLVQQVADLMSRMKQPARRAARRISRTSSCNASIRGGPRPGAAFSSFGCRSWHVAIMFDLVFTAETLALLEFLEEYAEVSHSLLAKYGAANPRLCEHLPVALLAALQLKLEMARSCAVHCGLCRGVAILYERPCYGAYLSLR